MTAKEMLEELMGTRCFCGEPKPAKKTFCTRCFYALPANMRKNLYKRIGEGYETAYNAAKTRLRGGSAE